MCRTDYRGREGCGDREALQPPRLEDGSLWPPEPGFTSPPWASCFNGLSLTHTLSAPVTQMVTAQYILPLLSTPSPLLVVSLPPSAMCAAKMPPVVLLDLANEHTGYSVKLEFQISNE